MMNFTTNCENTNISEEQKFPKIENCNSHMQFKNQIIILSKFLPIVLSKPAMSKSIFLFATNVANKYGHSPHFYGIAKKH